ncbi:MAG TPA: FkbM family methyltransferase [Verrucomicrobiae bacterium]|jgi:FkbM family methyltransferase
MSLVAQFKEARNGLAQRLISTSLFRKCVAPKTMRLGPDVKWVTISCGDHIITCSPNETIGKAIYQTGAYQRDLTERAINELSRRGLVKQGAILELGANIGTQSVYMMLTRKFQKIVCVEPDPRNVQLLEKNLKDNGFLPNATIIEAAAGDKDGSVSLNQFEHNHGRSSIVLGAHTGQSITVPMLSFDSILHRAKLRAEDIAFIWMDVEGAEPIVARAITKVFELKVPMALEYTPAAYGANTASEFIALLSNYYRMCVNIESSEAIERKTTELPAEGEQLNILLLP